jgi:small-conductance mechanosensitive channel/CRP-like cAMP-binding protein
MISLLGDFPDQIKGIAMLNKMLHLGIWVAGCWTFLSMSRIFFWEGIVGKRRGRRVPRLLTDLYSFVVITMAVILIAILVFQISPIAIGLMLGGVTLTAFVFFKDFLTNLFAGLSINLDDSIDIGHLIELPDGTMGIVDQINWRSTQLLQPGDNKVIVPNFVLNSAIVRNLSAQGDLRPISMEVTLDFSIPVERGIRVLTAALRSCVQEDGVAETPKSRVWAMQPGEFGITYKIDCYHHLDTSAEGEVRTRITSQIMNHLRSTGLAVSLPKQNIFVGEVRTMAMDWKKPMDRQKMIATIGLFQTLEPSEIVSLSKSLIIHQIPEGAEIITEGDSTTSMYGLAEGLLDVSVATADEQSLKVATMQPGDFFGEMSMLAGEPRTATVAATVDSVVFELNRESFKTILDQRDEITESISRLIAERQVSNNAMLESASKRDLEAAIKDATLSITGRIKSVFSNLMSSNGLG